MYEDFGIEFVNGILIIKLNMLRATTKEAKGFKDILGKNIQEGREKILVDLSDCNFVDSAILGVIVTKAKDLRQRGGDIRGIVGEGSVLNMFAQTGLEKVFKHYTSKELAILSFS